MGKVASTDGAKIPAAVGVDIGYGMIDARTRFTVGEFPEPVAAARAGLRAAYEAIAEQHPRVGRSVAPERFGTVGTGNPFIERCFIERDRVWVMLHSGTRGLGNRGARTASPEIGRAHV